MPIDKDSFPAVPDTRLESFHAGFRTRRDSYRHTTINQKTRFEKLEEIPLAHQWEDLPEAIVREEDKRPDPALAGFPTLDELEIAASLPSAPPDLIKKAIPVLAVRGRLDIAQELLFRLMHGEEDPEVVTLEGWVLLQRGDLEAAALRVTLVREKLPGHVSTLLLSAEVDRRQGRFESAIDSLVDAVKREVKSPDLYFYLAELYEEAGEIDLALKSLVKVLRMDAEHAAARWNLARLLGKKGLTEQGLDLLRRAIFRRQDQWEAYYGLGCLLARVDRFDGAGWAFRNALALPVPAHYRSVISFNIAHALAREGKFQESIAVFKPFTSGGDDALESLLDLSMVYWAALRPTEAAELLVRILERDPLHSRACGFLAWIYAECGEKELLVGLMERVARELPESMPYVERMASRATLPSFMYVFDVMAADAAKEAAAVAAVEAPAVPEPAPVPFNPRKTLSEADQLPPEAPPPTPAKAPDKRTQILDITEASAGQYSGQTLAEGTAPKIRIPPDFLEIVMLPPGKRMEVAEQKPTVYWPERLVEEDKRRVEEIVRSMSSAYDLVTYVSQLQAPLAPALGPAVHDEARGARNERADAAYHLGLDLQRLGKRDQALASFELALSYESSMSGALLAAARLRYERKDYEIALEFGRRAVAVDTENPIGHLLVGQLYYNKGRMDYAIEALRNAYNLDASLTGALLLVGLAREREGDPDAAIHYFRTFIEEAPGDPRGYRELLRVLDDVGDFEEGLRVAARAAEKEIVDPDVTHNECVHLYRLHRYEECEAKLAPVVSVHAYRQDTLLLLGLTRARLGNADGCLEAFDQIRSDLAEDPVIHYNRGTACLWLGLHERAVDHLRRAVALDPENRDYVLNLGIAYMRDGDPMEAIRQFHTARRIDPDCAEALVNQGAAKQQLKDYGGAIGAYKSVIANHPDYPEADKLLWNLGSAYYEAEDKYRSLSQFRNVLFLDPDNTDALLKVAELYMAIGEEEKAQVSYDRAMELKPTGGAKFVGITIKGFKTPEGDLIETLKKTEEELRKQEDPEKAWHWYNLGQVYASVEHYEDGLRCFDEAVRLDDGFWEARLARALSLHILERFVEALECYEDSLRRVSGSLIAMINAAVVTLQLGDPEAAIERLFAFLEVLDKEYLPPERMILFRSLAYYNLGVAYHDMGDTARARDCYRYALETDPSLVDAAYNLAFIGLQHGSWDEGHQWALKALEADPREIPGYVMYSRALRGMGRPAEAAESVQSGLLIHPGDPVLTMELAVSLAASDDRGGALAALEPLRSHPESGPEVKVLASLLEAEDPRARLALAESLLTEHPDSLEVRLYRVMAIAEADPGALQVESLRDLYHDIEKSKDMVALMHVGRILTRALVAQGKLGEAEVALEALVQAGWDQPLAYEARSRLRLAFRDSRGSLDDLAILREMLPGHPGPRLMTVRALVETGKNAQALEVLESIDPGGSPEMEALRKILESRAKPERTIADPEQVSLLWMEERVGRLLDEDRLDEALDASLAFVDRHPGDHRPLALLGAVLSRAGRPLEAAEVYRQAAVACPRSVLLEYNRAIASLQCSRLSEAIEDLERVTARGLDAGEPQWHRAWALGTLGRMEEARATFTPLRKLDDTPGEMLFMGAELALEAGEIDEARQIAQEVVSRQPRFSDGRRFLAWIHQKERRRSKAMKLLDRGEAMGCLELEARLDLAEYRLLEKDERGLPLALELALKREPEVARAFRLMGDHAVEQGEVEDAESCYRQALELDESSGETWLHLGVLLRLLERDDEAREAYLKALELSPEEPVVHLDLAAMALSHRDLAEARERIDHGLSVCGADADLLNARGMLLVRDGDFEEAERALDAALELDETLEEAWVNRGHVALLRQQPGEALRLLDRALEIKPDRVETLLNKTAALMDLARFDEALEVLAHLHALEPESLELALNLITLLLAKEQPELALDAIKDLMRRRGEDPDLWYLRGRTEFLLGRNDAALYSFAKAGELDPEAIEFALATARLWHRRQRPARTWEVLSLIEESYGPVEAWAVVAGAVARDHGPPELEQAIYERCLSRHPGAVAARVNLMAVHLELGDPAAALAIAEGASPTSAAKSPGLCFNSGLAHLLMGERQTAFDALRAAQHRLESPEGVDLLIGLPRLLDGRLKAAGRSFRRALRIDGSFWPTRLLEAVVLLMQGRWHDVVERLTDLQDMVQDTRLEELSKAVAGFEDAQALHRIGRTASEATRILQQALAAGDEAALADCLETAPSGDLEEDLWRARALFALDRVAEGEELLARHARVEAPVPQRLEEAMGQLMAGKRDEARSILETVLGGNPAALAEDRADSAIGLLGAIAPGEARRAWRRRGSVSVGPRRDHYQARATPNVEAVEKPMPWGTFLDVLLSWQPEAPPAH